MPQLFTLPRPRPLTTAGRVMPASKLYFYRVGTSTLADVYSDVDCTTEHANPVVADANGEFDAIYLNAMRDCSLKTSADVLVWGPETVGPLGEYSVRGFGAVGDGVTNDTTAVQTALDYMVANGVTIVFPSGRYKVDTDTLTIDGAWSIRGDGSESELYTTGTGTLLTFDINTTSVNGCTFTDMKFTGPSTTSATSIAMKFSGDATAFAQRSTFANIVSNGFYAFVKDVKSPRTTGFGLEAMLNWMVWDQIQIYGVYKYGWWLTQGSGTGNGWTNIRCQTTISPSSVFFFDGSGCVVGDVLINGIHVSCSDASGSNAVEIGASTVYRAQWALTNSQFDANCNVPVKMSGTGSTDYVNWNLTGNNYGGSTALGTNLQPLSGSIITDRDASDWLAGKAISTSSTGAIATDVFYVDFGSFGSVRLEVDAEGLIGGVQACASKYEYMVRTDGAALDIMELESTLMLASQLTWACTQVSATQAKLTLSYTPSSAGTKIGATVNGRGRNFKISRI